MGPPKLKKGREPDVHGPSDATEAIQRGANI